LGNHEYYTDGAEGYFGYFGSAAGARGRGYYSFDEGPWHVVVLNSNFLGVNDAAQEAWLADDLRAHAQRCTLAYFHHPRFSSGEHGNSLEVWPIWDILYANNVDVVLSAHDHHYERFAPQTPAGEHDPERGIREFVVGTGGAELRGFASDEPNSEFRLKGTFGVIRLSLKTESYRWEFLAAPAGNAVDSGEGQCH
jgi:3',5'-cyclic AMP phosphodiesterase CpdA